jgi:hypothetical protein
MALEYVHYQRYWTYVCVLEHYVGIHHAAQQNAPTHLVISLIEYVNGARTYTCTIPLPSTRVPICHNFLIGRERTCALRTAYVHVSYSIATVSWSLHPGARVHVSVPRYTCTYVCTSRGRVVYVYKQHSLKQKRFEYKALRCNGETHERCRYTRQALLVRLLLDSEVCYPRQHVACTSPSACIASLRTVSGVVCPLCGRSRPDWAPRRLARGRSEC